MVYRVGHRLSDHHRIHFILGTSPLIMPQSQLLVAMSFNLSFALIITLNIPLRIILYNLNLTLIQWLPNKCYVLLLCDSRVATYSMLRLFVIPRNIEQTWDCAYLDWRLSLDVTCQIHRQTHGVQGLYKNQKNCWDS